MPATGAASFRLAGGEQQQEGAGGGSEPAAAPRLRPSPIAAIAAFVVARLAGAHAVRDLLDAEAERRPL